MAWSTPHRLWAVTRTLAAGSLAVAVLTWAYPPHPAPLRLSIGTGGAGGVYHVYGAGLAEVTGARQDTEITALTTAASVENNLLVADGSLDAAFTLADVAALAVSGEEPFDRPLPVSAVARLYDNHAHVVVRADSPYEKVSDLAGGTVSVGAMGSGTEMMADRLLDLSGLEEVPASEGPGANPAGVVRLQLSIGNSALALENERIDAFFWSGGLPTQAVGDLAERVPIRLLDLADHVPDLVDAYGEYFSELPVPAGTYEGVPAVRTIGVPSLLVVNTRMSEGRAEEFTRLLFESQADLVDIHPVALHLHPRSAIATLPVPLHPGAADYYRSVKYAYDEPAADPGPP
ncbi:TAXI family TRAP transporter solute-binding subunit [Nocardiopsis ganjiahuensis]|uniref:TAXI family TRAP transporter solute-binding subunit n=1 Tax=Nocardiopsis ganjiahuensis TaxID=239984 RepID=UPI0003498AD9|nr:TAXI family TRAP transporter solute-binding subunit [Nocardiopsis ganjiahuensis]